MSKIFCRNQSFSKFIIYFMYAYIIRINKFVIRESSPGLRRVKVLYDVCLISFKCHLKYRTTIMFSSNSLSFCSFLVCTSSDIFPDCCRSDFLDQSVSVEKTRITKKNSYRI